MAKPHLPEIGEPVQILPPARFGNGGVYFLFFEGEVVYVGQAANMRKRIGQHLAEGRKIFDAVSCIPCGNRVQRERHYISALVPRYNVCAIAKDAKALAGMGISLEANQYTPKFVSEIEAAAMLGLPLSRFNSEARSKLRVAIKRVPRKNVKRVVYDTDSIREFAANRI